MSENNYGYCNYCGKYRPLKWNGGYCSEKCYCESGQQEQDTIDEERYQLMWYYRDDVVAFIFRTIVMSIGWMIYYLIVAQVCIKFKLVGLTRFLAIFQFPSSTQDCNRFSLTAVSFSCGRFFYIQTDIY